MTRGPASVRTLAVKRAIDVVGAGAGLLVLSPVLAAVWVCIRLRMGKPVLFTQIRPGLHGQPFRLYKFRTMLDARDAAGNLLPDEDRLTALGRALRATSLDELPELFNVVKGEMSLVGPRPLLMQYLELYSPRQQRRHHVRPGVTGWTQVNGRNDLPWDEKFELDVWYVDNLSVWLDLKILAKTLSVVVARKGISRSGHATTPFFTGSSDLPASD